MNGTGLTEMDRERSLHYITRKPEHSAPPLHPPSAAATACTASANKNGIGAQIKQDGHVKQQEKFKRKGKTW